MSGKKASGVSERHLLPLGLCWRVILNQSQPFKWSLFAKSRYVAGGEDLPTGLAGFGQVFIFIIFLTALPLLFFHYIRRNSWPAFQGEYYPYVYYKMNIDMVGAQNSVLGS